MPTDSVDYHPLGNRTAKAKSPNRRTSYTYDSVNRLESEVNFHAERTTSTYDAADRRTLLQKADGVRASFTFDAGDRLLARYDLRPDQSVASGVDYQYDNAGNRTAMREASSRRTTWSYDDSYQLINEHRSSASGGFQHHLRLRPSRQSAVIRQVKSSHSSAGWVQPGLKVE